MRRRLRYRDVDLSGTAVWLIGTVLLTYSLVVDIRLIGYGVHTQGSVVAVHEETRWSATGSDGSSSSYTVTVSTVTYRDPAGAGHVVGVDGYHRPGDALEIVHDPRFPSVASSTDELGPFGIAWQVGFLAIWSGAGVYVVGVCECVRARLRRWRRPP